MADFGGGVGRGEERRSAQLPLILGKMTKNKSQKEEAGRATRAQFSYISFVSTVKSRHALIIYLKEDRLVPKEVSLLLG